MGNPRYANGTLRRKYRARFRAMGCACGICKGKLGPIHYDEPSDAQHPLEERAREDERRGARRYKHGYLHVERRAEPRGGHRDERPYREPYGEEPHSRRLYDARGYRDYQPEYDGI